MSINPNRMKSSLCASERGTADGLMDVGVRAGRWVGGCVGTVPLAAIPSSTSSVHQYNRKGPWDSGNEDSGLSDSVVDDGVKRDADPCPGRRPALWCPWLAAIPPAPENSNQLRGPARHAPHHRTHDPMVVARRPGMSALGCQQRPSNPASALPCRNAGHRRVTDRSVATEQHRYRTDVHPTTNRSSYRREGVREKVRNMIGVPPL